MSEQAKLILNRDSVTIDEFHKLYSKLMHTTWTVDKQEFNLIKLGWKMLYNNRKRALGLCRFNGFTGKKEIYISKALLSKNKSEHAREFEDTIRHEIAHAIDFQIRQRSSHCEIWKSIAVQVGAKPDGDMDIIKSVDSKWTGLCNTCSKRVARHILRDNARNSACSKCCSEYNDGEWDSKYLLTWVKNF
jgi:predicted SprT family Zn-dependent metalloprotease